MRVSVLQETLARGLAIVSRAVASRSSLPLLNNILIATEGARLKLSATNLELSITTWVGAKTEQEGAITLPAKTLFELVTNLPPERLDLEFAEPSHALNLRCGSKTATFKGLDASEFPAVPQTDARTSLVFPAAKLRDMIEQVVFAAAKEGDRPMLTGILAQFQDTTCTFVATDGYGLAIYNRVIPNLNIGQREGGWLHPFRLDKFFHVLRATAESTLLRRMNHAIDFCVILVLQGV